MRNALLSGGSTFAHLLGRGKPPASPANPSAEMVEDTPLIETHTDPDDVDDEMDPKKRKPKPDPDNGDPDKILDQTTDKDEELDDAKLPGEDDDDADRKDAKASAARGRERARCARIFASDAAGRRPDVAAHLAFGTDMNASQVITTLRAVVAGERMMAAAAPPPAQAGAGLRGRMRQEPRYDVGTEAEQKKATGVADFAAKMKLADEKRRGVA